MITMENAYIFNPMRHIIPKTEENILIMEVSCDSNILLLLLLLLLLLIPNYKHITYLYATVTMAQTLGSKFHTH